jgi:hypothetical protein
LASVQVIAFRVCVVFEFCGDHVVPPFVVATTVALVPAPLFGPTAQQVVVLAQATRLSCVVTPDTCASHVAPSTVAAITPAAPTAQQRVALTHETPVRLCVTPELCEVQVEPPFVVARTSPFVPAPLLAPTAKQVLVLTHEMLLSCRVTPDACAIHDTPPSAVVRIVPFAPTAQQRLLLTQLTPASAFGLPAV